MNKKLKRKQALIMAEPYRTPFNSKVAKVSGDVIEDSVGEIKYATSFDGATKIEDANKNKIKIKDGVYTFGKSVNLIKFDDVENAITFNGMTYSIKDGVITVNGTPDAISRGVELYFKPININIGDTYSIALFNQFTSPVGFFVKDKSNSGEANQYLGINENIATTWTVNAGSEYQAIVFYLEPNKTYTNLVIKPILVSGSTIPTKYYSGSYGIKIEIADGVMTCNGMLASDTPVDKLWLKFDTILPSGIYSGNIFLNSRQINAWVCHDLYEWANAYQFAVKEHNTPPKANINVKMDCKYVYFEFGKNYGFDNLILKPMLVLGTTAPTEFEPNFKNLLEIGDLSERTKDGLTYYYKNGMIVVNGTSNGGYTHIYDNVLGAEYFEDGATYSFNDISNNNNLYLQFSLAKKDGTTQYLTKKNSFIWDSNIYSICYIAVQTAPTITTFNNIVIKPTFVKSSIIPSQFIPFANPYFVSLGQNGSVQYNGLESREIDLKGNVLSKINNQASDKLSNYALTKNTKVVDLGSLAWGPSPTSTSRIYRLTSTDLKDSIVGIASNNKGNLLCTMYITVSGDTTYGKTKGIAVGPTGTVIIYDPEYNTSDKLEAFKKAIRGTLLMYQIKNPTTINTTSFKTFKEDTNATISDDNFTSSPNAITETFKPTRSYDFKVNGFSNVVKSSNLLSLPDIEENLGGIEFKIKNGIVTINGTSDSNQTLYLNLKSKISSGTYSFNSFASDGTRCDIYLLSPQTQVYTSNNLNLQSIDGFDTISFFVVANTNYNNLIIKPMLVSGSTIPTHFIPYLAYIESFADKRNFIEINDVESTTTNGITYSIKNGVIKLNGTPTTGEFILVLFSVEVDDTSFVGTYLVKNFGTLKNSYLNVWYGFYDAKPFQWEATQVRRIQIQIPHGETVNGTLIPMLVSGITPPTTFLPYQDKYSAFLNVKGKNLFDNANTPLVDLTFNGSNQDLFEYSGYFTKAIYLKKGKYTFKSDNLMIIGKAINWTGDYGSKVGEVVKVWNATIELEKDMYVLITNNYQFDYEQVFETLIVVEGDKIPEYEPYYSFTKEVLIKQPLRKFDYLTYDGVYRQTNEIVLDGTNNLYVDESSGTIQVLNIPNVDSLNTDWGINYASQLMVTTSNLPLIQSYLIQVEKQKGIGTNNGRIFIKLDDSSDNSLNNWTFEKVNNYFKQNPITITYKTVDQTFEATSLTRLLFKNGYNKITAFDSINNNAIVEYLEYYKSK